MCDHLGSAEAALWWCWVGDKKYIVESHVEVCVVSLWMSHFIFLCSQLLGHEWQRCHLVGDQGTCACFNHGMEPLSLSIDNIKTIFTLPMIFIIIFFNINIFFYRSTLFSLLASSSSSSRSYSPQILVEMNPVFTCEKFDFSFCLTLKQHISLAAYDSKIISQQLCYFSVFNFFWYSVLLTSSLHSSKEPHLNYITFDSFVIVSGGKSLWQS